MSVMDALRPKKATPDAVPGDIDDRIRRGRVARDKDKDKRRICQKFWEGDQYWYEKPGGGLGFQTAGIVGVVGPDKASYRIRNTYNFIQAVVEAKTSAATQKVPGYETTPSTDDPEDQAAAILAAQVAHYGYDQWRLRRHTTKAVTNAFVKREGFAMPYFDQNVGPYRRDGDKWVGDGDVKVRTFSRDELMWEPDVDFDDSPWWAIEQAMLKSQVRELPGYIQGTLTEDSAANGDKAKVIVTDYIERPCPKYPHGRRVFLADGKIIVDHRQDPEVDPAWTDWWEPYPCMDADGVVCDELVIHRISYTVNPDGDDMGLVERIIDLQRTVNDTWNKILELKNRALMLQGSAPRGSNVTPRNDVPGATVYYNVIGGKGFEWEQPPSPQYLQQLMQIHEQAKAELRELASDVFVEPQPDLAARTANAAIEQSQQRWQSFLGDLAEFHSRLMRSCLMLVARYYSEDRQIQIRGQYGWQPLAAFTGQDLRSQVNVRVLPGSLEAKSRLAIQREIEFIQANWPGAITPEAALATLHGGTAEGLIRSYENDVAKAWRVVRRLQVGPDAMASFGTRFDPTIPNPNFIGIDPATGMPLVNPLTGKPEQQMGADVPNWMPAEWDSVQIWRQVIGDYMKTEDFERRPEETRESFYLVWNGLEEAERMRAAKQAAQQQMQAQSLGMNNAAAPQTPPPLPDRAGFTPENQSPAQAA